MTDKQRIIDGMECRYWFIPNPNDYRKCSLRGQDDNCDEIKDCFIKELLGKLKAKEQECERLKDKLNCCFCNPHVELNDFEKQRKCVEVTECFRRQLDQLKSENEQLKQAHYLAKEILKTLGVLDE